VPKLNPVPLTVAAVIVTLELLVLVSVSDKLELLPTPILPNARLVGFAVSAPDATAVAVAVSETRGCAFGPTREIVVLESPAAEGRY